MSNKKNQKVIILGGSGMLGHTLFKYFNNESSFVTLATLRKKESINKFDKNFSDNLLLNYDANDIDKFKCLLEIQKPDVVINCIGIIKQIKKLNNVPTVLPINSIFPHRIASICNEFNIRFIHISTDCVFNGDKGMYSEEEVPNSTDLYGISKALGETHKYFPNSLTIRTSIIGPELSTENSLLNWFLSQTSPIKGYKKAIFSGLTTNELAKVIFEHILPNNDLRGLYHVSSNPISKFELLNLFAKYYKKEIEIIEDEELVINRSLDSIKFKKITGYNPPTWNTLIKEMSEF